MTHRIDDRHSHAGLDLPFDPPTLGAKGALSMMRAMALLSDELDREFSRHFKLNFSDVLVLVQIALAGGRLKMADVAETIVVTRGGVTKLVDRLVRLGYLRRVPSDEDRRVIYAELADEGRKLLADAQGLLEDVVQRRLGNLLSTDQLEQLHLIAHTLSCDNEGWGMPEAIGDDLQAV